MAKTNEKAKRTAKPIVEAYLERIGQKVFKDFSSVITGLIKGNLASGPRELFSMD